MNLQELGELIANVESTGVENQVIEWAFSDKSIATVDVNGKRTVMAVEQTKIIVTMADENRNVTTT